MEDDILSNSIYPDEILHYLTYDENENVTKEKKNILALLTSTANPASYDPTSEGDKIPKGTRIKKGNETENIKKFVRNRRKNKIQNNITNQNSNINHNLTNNDITNNIFNNQNHNDNFQQEQNDVYNNYNNNNILNNINNKSKVSFLNTSPRINNSSQSRPNSRNNFNSFNNDNGNFIQNNSFNLNNESFNRQNNLLNTENNSSSLSMPYNSPFQNNNYINDVSQNYNNLNAQFHLLNSPLNNKTNSIFNNTSSILNNNTNVPFNKNINYIDPLDQQHNVNSILLRNRNNLISPLNYNSSFRHNYRFNSNNIASPSSISKQKKYYDSIHEYDNIIQKHNIDNLLSGNSINSNPSVFFGNLKKDEDYYQFLDKHFINTVQSRLTNNFSTPIIKPNIFTNIAEYDNEISEEELKEHERNLRLEYASRIKTHYDQKNFIYETITVKKKKKKGEEKETKKVVKDIDVENLSLSELRRILEILDERIIKKRFIDQKMEDILKWIDYVSMGNQFIGSTINLKPEDFESIKKNIEDDLRYNLSKQYDQMTMQEKNNFSNNLSTTNNFYQKIIWDIVKKHFTNTFTDFTEDRRTFFGIKMPDIEKILRVLMSGGKSFGGNNEKQNTDNTTSTENKT